MVKRANQIRDSLINTVALARCRTVDQCPQPFQRLLDYTRKTVKTVLSCFSHVLHRAEATVLMRIYRWEKTSLCCAALIPIWLCSSFARADEEQFYKLLT